MATIKKENTIKQDDIVKDVDLIMWSVQLSELYRFTHQRFWERETTAHEFAMRIDGLDFEGNKVPRAESVAEHSWHICDIALIIAPRFKDLNVQKCLLHAVLHDKLEIITGDKNPLGRDGKGTKTHAFNEEKRQAKDILEMEAMEVYLKKLNEQASLIQKEILEDTIYLKSNEAKFIKAIDKIHPLVYILRKKGGNMIDEHINFTLKYTSTCINFFPDIEPYYREFINRLFIEISNYRKIDVNNLKLKFSIEQLTLFNT
jgi:5'-deoxynucleotidase YfbR-like HD superfamily hydrolase